MAEPFDRPEVVAASQAWAAAGRWIDAGDGAGLVRPASPPPRRGNPPLLVLHGFPTCSYDWKSACSTALRRRARRGRARRPRLRPVRQARPPLLDPRLRRRRRGGRSPPTASPRSTSSPTTWATRSAASSSARTLEGTLGLAVRRRVVTNGSIYIDMAQLTLGQQVLLGPARRGQRRGRRPTAAPAFRAGFVGTFAPDTLIDDATELDLDVTVHLAVAPGRPGDAAPHHPLHRGPPGRGAPLHRRHRGPTRRRSGVVWGDLDPVAVHAMARSSSAARPGTAADHARRRRPLPDGRGARPRSPPPCSTCSTTRSPEPSPTEGDPMTIEITLLGTGTPLPDPNRAGPSTLVRAGGKTFLFDAGRAVGPAPRRGRRRWSMLDADPAHPPPQRPHHRPQRRHHRPLGHQPGAQPAADHRPGQHAAWSSTGSSPCSAPTSATASPTTRT